MTDRDYREPVTETVVEQLREVLATGRIDDPVNWMNVQVVATDRGLGELAQFVVDADAATYYEALERARADPDE